MRICLISREYPPDTGFGGIATFARHLAHGLIELNHQVEVVALSLASDSTAFEEGVLVHRVCSDVLKDRLGAMSMCMPYSRYVLQTSTALWKKFQALHKAQPFDVVDAPELLAEGIYVALTKAAPLVIRLYTPHSKFIAEKLHNVTSSFDHEFVATLERMSMLYADALTSPSEDLAKFVASDLNIETKEIHIVHNPIDPEQFSPQGPLALPSEDGALTVLFVGRLEERKGISYLIDAFPHIVKAYANVRLVIIGDDTNNAPGQKSVLAQIKNTIAHYGLTHHITFIPRVPLSDLPAYYRSADISCVPSVYDNSPYTCLEAMSCGRPVIGTSAGGTNEYIVDGESGLVVPPRDSQALYQAILRLLLDAPERKRLGTNARKRVLEKFRRQEIAEETLKVYEQACHNYQTNKAVSLYLDDLGQAASDAESFLCLCDSMLYDMLYHNSLGFRFQHWWKLANHRPRLTAAKILLKASQSIVSLIGLNEKPTWLKLLARQVEDKEKGIGVHPFEQVFQLQPDSTCPKPKS